MRYTPLHLDVTSFITGDMSKFSASVAELGKNAGWLTWNNSVAGAGVWRFLDTHEKLEEFKRFVRESGFDPRPDENWDALCLQWIAGDVRESGFDTDAPDDEHGRLYRGDDGRVYWTTE